MSASRRKLLGLLAVPLAATTLAGSLSGCGSTSATLDPVAQAAETTSAAGGVQIQFDLRLGIAQLSSPVSASGEGFFNYATHEGKLAFEMTGLPGSATAALGTGRLRSEEILKQSTIYVGSPLLAGRLPHGARWLRVDLAKLDKGLDLSGLMGGESDPAQFIEFLRAHGGSVTTLGSETVDGVHTTHYRGSIDPQKVAQNLPAPDRAAARSLLEQLRTQTGLAKVPFDAWVDDQHRIRRMQTSFSLNAAGQQVAVQLTINLSGYGSTPTVAAPAASEVAEVPSGVPGLAG